MTFGFVDREGRSIDLERWSVLIAQEEYKRVAETTVGDWWVSTVWLGVELGGGTFETMVFGVEDREVINLDEALTVRYSSEAEALAGHDVIVRLVELDQEVKQEE